MVNETALWRTHLALVLGPMPRQIFHLEMKHCAVNVRKKNRLEDFHTSLLHAFLRNLSLDLKLGGKKEVTDRSLEVREEGCRGQVRVLGRNDGVMGFPKKRGWK